MVAVLSMEGAKSIYRAAVDERASDSEGHVWWAAVHAEMTQVLAARSVREAAKVIAWWHHDWSQVSDSAAAAARRIRTAARTLPH